MNQQKSKKKQPFNFALHGQRGLAALMVYIAHSIDGYNTHLCGGCRYSPAMEHLSYLGFYGVEVFFFLSGYVIYSASLNADLHKFATHRFWRIYPVFVFFTLLYFVLNHVVQKDPQKDELLFLFANLSFLNLFLDTPALSPNAWSITYEIWYYVLTFAVVRPFVIRKNYGFAAIGLLVWGYFMWKFPISFYFILGVLTNIGIRRFGDGLYSINSRIVNVTQAVALATVLYFGAKQDYRYHWQFMVDEPSVFVLLLAFLLFMITLFHPGSFATRTLQKRTWMMLGTVSYTLYLAHPYSYLVARMLASRLVGLGVPELVSTTIFIAVNLILTVLAVKIVFKYLENMFYRYGTGKEIYEPAPHPPVQPTAASVPERRPS